MTSWTTDSPTTPGWYWLRRAAFQGKQGVWHEPRPIIVELALDGVAGLTMYVPGTDWTRPLSDLVSGEWVGPLPVPD